MKASLGYFQLTILLGGHTGQEDPEKDWQPHPGPGGCLNYVVSETCPGRAGLSSSLPPGQQTAGLWQVGLTRLRCDGRGGGGGQLQQAGTSLTGYEGWCCVLRRVTSCQF